MTRKEIYLPTLNDIHRECDKIQQGWSEREQYRRTVYHNIEQKWSPPTIDTIMWMRNMAMESLE